MIPFGFKLGYLVFVAVLVPVYAVEHGWMNFLWLSNVALLGGLLAAWLESRRLAGMMAVAVVLLETGWIVDFLASLVLAEPAPLGAVSYMFDPEIPLFVRLLSLYHLPLPLALVWMVWRLGYDPQAWKWWVVTGWGILLLSFLLARPGASVNWVLGPGAEVQDWMHPWLWLGLVTLLCTLAWWLTHRLLLALMGHLGRVARAGVAG